MTDNATLRRRLVAIAESKVGVHEEGGNNKGNDVLLFQLATALTPAPWAWCAAFVDWCVREWLRDPEVRDALRLPTARAAEDWRPRTARAFGMEDWGTRHGLQVLPENAVARAGDLVTFDFSHVGIVAVDQPAHSGMIETIEGNTNGHGGRDSASGDGVWRKTRAVPLVNRYIRLLS
jgi:hypothetical protein